MVRVVRRCETGRLRWLCLAVLFVIASVVSSAAADDQVSPPDAPRAAAPSLPASADFLFGAPRGWLSVRGSFLVPRAGGDLFSFVEEQLTLDRGDFRSGGVATDVGIAITPLLDVVGGFDITRKESSSEYRHFVASNDQPITQSTRLRQATVSGGVRYSPLGRGRSISRYAFIPRRVVPYAGAGVTLGFYDFSQRGQFVDYADRSIFTDRFASNGWAAGPYFGGGVDVQVWKRLSVTFDARYTWLRSDLDTDFSGFDGIDLAGLRGGSGISLVF